MNTTQIPPYEDKYIDVQGIRLHYIKEGEGPIILFIHGFPECWYMWKQQIDYFSKKGYTCIGLDLRGCNLSDKPIGKKEYLPSTLAKDIVEVIRNLEGSNITIITAGLGILPVTIAASEHPTLIKKIVCINAPHPIAYAKSFWSLAHLNKAWYVLLHQLPILPEMAWASFDYLGIKYYFSRLTESTLPTVDMDNFMKAIKQPKAVSSMINYYRNIREIFSVIKTKKQDLHIIQPSLNIYSKHHPGFSRKIIDVSQQYFMNSTLQVLEEGICMLQWTSADKVNASIQEFVETTHA